MQRSDSDLRMCTETKFDILPVLRKQRRQQYIFRKCQLSIRQQQFIQCDVGHYTTNGDWTPVTAAAAADVIVMVMVMSLSGTTNACVDTQPLQFITAPT